MTECCICYVLMLSILGTNGDDVIHPYESIAIPIPVFQTHVSLPLPEPVPLPYSIDRESLLHMVCMERIGDLSCERRDICLATGHSFSNTCEYHAAKCQRKVPADAQHVPCDAPTMSDCTEYLKKEKCDGEPTQPVCGYITNHYYKNLCEACMSDADRQGTGAFVQLTKHKRCIMERTGDSKIIEWAQKKLDTSS